MVKPVIVRYEREVRLLLAEPGRAQSVRGVRVDRGLTWRGVAEMCQELWKTDFASNDTQSFGVTICHVATEILGENPDAEPWN